MRPNANIFQIIISSDPEPLVDASPSLAANAESFKLLHPDHDYHLLNGADIESILAADFGTDVQRAYAALRPYAFKADLARYCLLLRHGGIYADLSMRLLNPIALPSGKSAAFFRDALFAGKGLWWVHNGLIRAPAGREELRVAVEMTVANCTAQYYGASAVHPTGPALLGRALAMVDHEEDIEVGEFRNFSGSMNPHSYGYLDGQGRLIAMRMKTRHLADLGVKGTNFYYELWDRRAIYRDAILHYQASHPAIAVPYGNRSAGGIVFDEAMDNFITFGPYATLEAGRYRAWFDAEIATGPQNIVIDVHVPGAQVIASATPLSLDDPLALEFHLPARTDGVEVRFRTSCGASGRITALNIQEIDWDRPPKCEPPPLDAPDEAPADFEPLVTS